MLEDVRCVFVQLVENALINTLDILCVGVGECVIPFLEDEIEVHIVHGFQLSSSVLISTDSVLMEHTCQDHLVTMLIVLVFTEVEDNMFRCG